ncbi:MAG: hypothetical protein KJ927_16840 [Candidatus Eisenbacteria bacterium]|nr:hypothetical protein [Candidatus Eisenbacteria bacterium]MBU1950384.1 hypothetical protein [Candidatus Eisenbacteria bacterium]
MPSRPGNHLDDPLPGEALAAYEQIIASGDIHMRDKAQAGKCRCLKALGRDKEAADAGCDG